MELDLLLISGISFGSGSGVFGVRGGLDLLGVDLFGDDTRCCGILLDLRGEAISPLAQSLKIKPIFRFAIFETFGATFRKIPLGPYKLTLGANRAYHTLLTTLLFGTKLMIFRFLAKSHLGFWISYIKIVIGSFLRASSLHGL